MTVAGSALGLLMPRRLPPPNLGRMVRRYSDGPTIPNKAKTFQPIQRRPPVGPPLIGRAGPPKVLEGFHSDRPIPVAAVTQAWRPATR